MAYWLGLWAATTVAWAGDWTTAEPLTADPTELVDAADAFHVDGAPVEILLRSRTVSFDGEGRRVVVNHLIYEVVRVEDARSWGNAAAAWSPWYQDRPNIQARVISPRGQVRPFDPSTLVEEDSAGDSPLLYSDGKSVRGPFVGLTSGSIVEEVVRYVDHTPFLAAGASDVQYIVSPADYPVAHVRYEASAPTSAGLQLVAHEVDARITKRQADGQVTYTIAWSPPVADPKADERWRQDVPQVVPPWPHIVASTYPDWRAVARTYGDLIAEGIDATGLEDLVADVAAAPDRDEAVRRAVRGVQTRMRYTGVEFGQQAIVPYRPSVCIDRGFGDCKDQATAVVAVLRAAGHRASVALVGTGSGSELRPEPVVFARFDHAIVVVQGKGDPLWVDPTAPWLPIGDLPRGDQDRYALIVDDKTKGLVRTPAIKGSYHELREIDLSQGGRPTIHETTTTSGWNSHAMRIDFAKASQAEQEQWMEDYARDTYGTDDEAPVVWAVRGTGPDEPVVVLEASVPGSSFGWGGISDTVAKVGASQIDGGLSVLEAEGFPGGVTAHADTPGPAIRILPQRSTVRWRVHLAPGFVAQQPLEPLSLRVGPALLTRTMEAHPSGFDIVYAADVDATTTTFAELEALRRELSKEAWTQWAYPEFISDFLDAEERGEIATALRAGREAVEAHPGSVPIHAQWVETLGRLGLLEASRAQSKALISNAPDSVLAWFAQRAAHMRNTDGEYDRTPYARDEALAAARRILTFLPNDTDEQDLLIGLLLLGRGDGTADTHPDDLAEAVSIVEGWHAEAVREDNEERAADLAALRRTLLFDAGRYDALQDLPEPGASAEAWADTILAIGVIQGPDAMADALREVPHELAEAVGDTDISDLGPTLDSGLLKVWTRAKAERSPEGSEARQMADLFESLKPWRKVLPANDPRRPLLTLIEWAARPGPVEPEELRTQVDVSGMPPDIVEYVTLSALVNNGKPLSPKEASFLPTFADLAAKLPLKVEQGLDGSRLVHMSLPGRSGDSSFVVVGKGQRMRIRALGGVSISLAYDAVAALDAGEDALARERILWARTLLQQQLGDKPLLTLIDRLVAQDALRVASGVMRVHVADDQLFDALEREARDLPRHLSDGVIGAVIGGRSRRAEPRDLERIDALIVEHELATRMHPVLVKSLRRDQPDEALRYARDATVETPQDKRAWLLYADLLGDTGDPAGSVDAYRTAVSLGSATSTTHNNLAWQLLRIGEAEEALDLLNERVGDWGKASTSTLHTLAMAYLLNHRPADAQKVYDEVRFKEGMSDPAWLAVAAGLAVAWGVEERGGPTWSAAQAGLHDEEDTLELLRSLPDASTTAR